MQPTTVQGTYGRHVRYRRNAFLMLFNCLQAGLAMYNEGYQAYQNVLKKGPYYSTTSGTAGLQHAASPYSGLTATGSGLQQLTTSMGPQQQQLGTTPLHPGSAASDDAGHALAVGQGLAPTRTSPRLCILAKQQQAQQRRDAWAKEAANAARLAYTEAMADNKQQKAQEKKRQAQEAAKSTRGATKLGRTGRRLLCSSDDEDLLQDNSSDDDDNVPLPKGKQPAKAKKKRKSG